MAQHGHALGDRRGAQGGGSGRGFSSSGGYIPPPIHHESNRYLLTVKDGTYSWCSPAMATEEIGRRIFRPLATVTASSDRVSAQDYSPLFDDSWLSNPEGGGADLWILGPLNIKLRAGQLLVVSGEMGCGKSSLLLALLGERCILYMGMSSSMECRQLQTERRTTTTQGLRLGTAASAAGSHAARSARTSP